MKRYSLRIGIALAVVLGVGTLFVGRSGAQDLQVQRAQVLTPLVGQAALRAISNCPAATAASTLTLAAGQASVESQSPVNYGTDTCNRYVVDINVASNSTPGPGYTNQFTIFGVESSDNGISTGVSQQECASFHVDVAYYKKANGAAAFTQIGTARFNGSWVGANVPPPGFGANSCHLTPAANNNVPAAMTRPSAGTDVYRVAVRAYTSSSLRRVKAGANRVQNPPS